MADQAQIFLIKWLRDRSVRKNQYPSYGYDVYLPNVMRDYLVQNGGDWRDVDIRPVSADFYAAGWELCRRGILRPGIRTFGVQSTPDGSAGNGYSVTPFGQQWITESDRDDFVPTEPERSGKMLAPFQKLFGPQFSERAQEAVRCYGAHAYLACCAMCGAAAESILLSTAIAKRDEESMLRSYRTAGGRSRLVNILVGHAREQLKREFQGFLTLLKYWRDEASHGRPSRIGDNEALTSLALVLRFAAFTRDHWAELGTRLVDGSSSELSRESSDLGRDEVRDPAPPPGRRDETP